jgi:Sec-independent protein translocase protein TatA
MDGILGVGVPELILIMLVIFVVGGPQNTLKWARELGRWTRKARQMWGQLMADLEKEIGPEGKEALDAAREIGQEVRQITGAASPHRIVGNAAGLLDPGLDGPAAPPPAPASLPPDLTDSRYPAWQPPQDADTRS